MLSLAYLFVSQSVIASEDNHLSASQPSLKLSQQLIAKEQLREDSPLEMLLNQEDTETVNRHLFYLMTSMKTPLATLTEDQQHLKKQRLTPSFLITDKQVKPIPIHHASFDKIRGKLPWPTTGSLIARFGNILSSSGQQAGVIIKTADYAPVRAIYPGKVIFSNWLRGFGILVIINHGKGYLSLYARNHLSTAKVGDTVKMGDIIATTGTRYGSQPPTLYFEIRQHGVAVNPMIWCR